MIYYAFAVEIVDLQFLTGILYRFTYMNKL